MASRIQVVKPIETPSLADAHPLVSEALREGSVQQLKESWRAHLNLRISAGIEPVRIRTAVLERLQALLERTIVARTEHPFYCVESNNEIVDIVLAPSGSYGQVTFEIGGREFRKALEIARETSGKVALGHTHPAGYGPIFSHVQTISTKYGDDHLAALEKYSTNSVSPFHLIVAFRPSTQQPLLGVWSAEKGGYAIINSWSEKREPRVKLRPKPRIRKTN